VVTFLLFLLMVGMAILCATYPLRDYVSAALAVLMAAMFGYVTLQFVLVLDAEVISVPLRRRKILVADVQDMEVGLAEHGVLPYWVVNLKVNEEVVPLAVTARYRRKATLRQAEVIRRIIRSGSGRDFPLVD
jgi:hypothetical protein